MDAAESRKDLAARATMVRAELAGEAFSVAKAPVEDQPKQALLINTQPHGAQIFRKLQTFD